MELSIISIGNSKGIRLPKAVIDKYNIKDTVEITLQEDGIILKPKPSSRKGWEASFKEMYENGDDHLLVDDVFEDENFEGWS